ncbi:MAG: DUF364 domain-containing protein [Eggerthellaceae bacterium]|nr:DUF364 domain-containing protein [Eggerthellaceae bacterium]
MTQDQPLINPWSLYDEMIEGIPEDLTVVDYCIGKRWCYVKTEKNLGVAFSVDGGRRTHKEDLRGRSLKDVARLSKSFNFPDASVGVAALNAYYAHPDKLAELGYVWPDPEPDGTFTPEEEARQQNVFARYVPIIQAAENPNVAIIGHFPHVERYDELFPNLTVFERMCRSNIDTPDTAEEYMLPDANYAFITGVSIVNKTAPRLLELTKDAHTIMTGPSCVPAQAFFDRGVETIATSYVKDIERAEFSVKTGAPELFGKALVMALVSPDKIYDL